LLEIGLAVWAALSPLALARLDLEPAFGLRALGVAAVLLPATLAMGATFPLMGRLAIGERDAAGVDTARFYGVNTLGACAGALLAPAWLLPTFGLARGLAVAALFDAVAGVLALGLVVGPRASAAHAPSEGSAPARILAVTALLGAASLALEVVLTRLLIHVTGATLYAFAIVLAVFLLGIGWGSLAGREALSRERAGAAVLERSAAWAAPLALAGLLALRLLLGERDLFGSLANRQPAGGATWRLWLFDALAAAVAFLPVTFAFGRALPAAVAAALEARPRAAPERVLGAVYLANTAGALVGALAGGFLLLPVVGPRAGVALALAPAALAAFVPRARGRAPWTALAAALLLAVFALAPPRTSDARTLSLAFGSNSTVAVEEGVEPDGAVVRSLRVNGKVEATTAPVDMRLQRLLAHVPGLLHGRVRSALVIGLGTGMTAGALLDLPTLERLDVFELEPRLPAAAALFAEWNGALLDDARTHVTLADGRVALARSARRFDLITADPLHPATRGSSDLFSLEHFQAMADHLAEGGVASQWLPLYELSTLDVRTVVATWCAAFEHTSAWLTAYDLALVGSRAPLPERVGELPPAVARRLAEVGVHGPLDLEALLVARDGDLRTWSAGVTPMTLDRPILEARAPLSFLAGYSTEVLAWAGRAELVATLSEAVQPRAREGREHLRRFLAELPDGWSLAAANYGRALLGRPALAPPAPGD
ncbi:MAG TPA: fused MFS/spermidine synthase, partial [Planctomycetota bacterium]|nr:fused MFS/spermidine synthase [Planctomycetota bacterium]